MEHIKTERWKRDGWSNEATYKFYNQYAIPDTGMTNALQGNGYYRETLTVEDLMNWHQDMIDYWLEDLKDEEESGPVKGLTKAVYREVNAREIAERTFSEVLDTYDRAEISGARMFYATEEEYREFYEECTGNEYE